MKVTTGSGNGLGVVRQNITWTNVEKALWREMVLLDHNELNNQKLFDANMEQHCGHQCPGAPFTNMV